MKWCETPWRASLSLTHTESCSAQCVHTRAWQDIMNVLTHELWNNGVYTTLPRALGNQWSIQQNWSVLNEKKTVLMILPPGSTAVYKVSFLPLSQTSLSSSFRQLWYSKGHFFLRTTVQPSSSSSSIGADEDACCCFTAVPLTEAPTPASSHSIHYTENTFIYFHIFFYVKISAQHSSFTKINQFRMEMMHLSPSSKPEVIIKSWLFSYNDISQRFLILLY